MVATPRWTSPGPCSTVPWNVPKKLVRASIEKNRHLFAWKHLDGEALEAYLDGLGEELADAVASEDRERLAWLSLALDQLPEALQARRRAQALRIERRRAGRDVAQLGLLQPGQSGLRRMFHEERMHLGDRRQDRHPVPQRR